MKQESLVCLACGLVAGIALMWAMQSGGGRWQVIQAEFEGCFPQEITKKSILLDTATGKSYFTSRCGSPAWLPMSLTKSLAKE